MFKVAVCDDEETELERTETLLKAFFAQRPETEASLALFRDGRGLVDALERGEDFDLYLLDVLMPGCGGIEAGKAVRRLGRGGEIVYLTTSPDYAVDSYLTRALFYLVKPVEREQLFEVLGRVVDAFQKRLSQAAAVNTPSGTRSIPLHEILYVERADRWMRYHLMSGETVDSGAVHGPLREAAETLLADGRFFLCGADLALGLHHVRSVEQNEALLDSGVRVPVPRSACAGLKRAWMNYWLGGETV